MEHTDFDRLGCRTVRRGDEKAGARDGGERDKFAKFHMFGLWMD
jgi:hypothetical protein